MELKHFQFLKNVVDKNQQTETLDFFSYSVASPYQWKRKIKSTLDEKGKAAEVTVPRKKQGQGHPQACLQAGGSSSCQPSPCGLSFHLCAVDVSHHPIWFFQRKSL